MLPDEDLQAMDPGERGALLQRILEIHHGPSLAEGQTQRERYVAITALAATFLVGWIVYLAATLPRTYTTGHWRLTWVGFDCALAFLLAATALLALWRRQLVIVTSVVAGSLLVGDAWFDTTTAAGSERWFSLISVPVEVVLAAVLFGTAELFLRHVGSALPGSPPHSGPRLCPCSVRGPVGSDPPCGRCGPRSEGFHHCSAGCRVVELAASPIAIRLSQR
jgi:hypothetical protein